MSPWINETELLENMINDTAQATFSDEDKKMFRDIVTWELFKKKWNTRSLRKPDIRRNKKISKKVLHFTRKSL